MPDDGVFSKGSRVLNNSLVFGCPILRAIWYFHRSFRPIDMNVPNKLTLSRLALTVAFLSILFSEMPYHETISLVLFSVAGLTDYFDGKIARRDKLITNFGILMDPLADKILICSAFIAFVGRGWIPAWMVVIVVARELAITGLRLLAASRNVVLAAEQYGKHKTISQIVAIISVLVLASYRDWRLAGDLVFGWTIAGKPWVYWFTEISVWVAILLTVFSGSVYLWRNRKIYLTDV
jgi:CDP-diacylglycerol---glycerol-3-phosphate 3-phosphatidyltransferase